MITVVDYGMGNLRNVMRACAEIGVRAAVTSDPDAVRKAGLNAVKVMIGGAPITREFAKEIGADGFAPDAASAVDEAMKLLAA